MKRILIVLVSFLLLTGCNNYNDINNLAIINEIAIKYDKEYEIYIKVLANNQNNENKIYKEKGLSIEDCFNNLNNKLTKKLYLTHLDLLILDNNLTKKEYKEVINYFLNEETSRNNFRTIITNNITKDFLKIDSKDIINQVDLSIKSTGIVKNKQFEEIIKNILNYKLDYIPYIDSNTKEIEGYQQVYEENKKLSKEESLAVNFIFNNIENITLLINNKTYKIENCKTNLIPKNNKINIELSCNYQGKEKGKEIIYNYLNQIIQSFITNNNLNYFNYLNNKFNIKNELGIITNINISLIETDSGDNFA